MRIGAIMEVIRELVEEAERSMRGAGLSECYIDCLRGTWKAFDRWLSSKGLQYSPSHERAFLLDAYGVDGGSTTVGMCRRYRRALAILRNCHEHEPYRMLPSI